MNDVRRSRDGQVLLLTAGYLLFAFVVIRTAWLCDDAYITFRTIDNLVHGYGLRWNIAERVQSYTHPLWLLLLAGPYAVTREAYFTPLVVSMLLAFAAVWLFLTRIASSTKTALIGLTAFIFSKAFVQYSTSGLENPLTFLLLAAFFVVYWRRTERRQIPLWFIAGLLMLNRLDLGILVLPMLGVDAWNRPWRDNLRTAILGLSPLIAWEIFSIIYYGFPFPNTAYAKLQTGVPARALVGQGLLYLLDSIAEDPVTLLVTAMSVVVCLRFRLREAWPVVLGIGLYLVYIARIGGDFMSGRFLAAPFLCAVAAVAHFRWSMSRATVSVTLATIALAGVVLTPRPPITISVSSELPAHHDPVLFGVGDVADEWAFYYPYTGLLHWSRSQPLPHAPLVDLGRVARTKSDVVVSENTGLFGYFAGPDVYIVDAYGLGDPLLARLPALPRWRIGHFERPVPDGYMDSIRTGRNRIGDVETAALYDRMKLITEGPIWSRRRWRAIRRMNVGW